VKPGYKTTEFWVSALTAVGLLVAAASTSLPPRYAAIGAAVSSSAYAISRGIAKISASWGTLTPPPEPPSP
jgi:hypothetical protein